MARRNGNLFLLRVFERIRGDKIVLIILMLLIGISMLTISSSTSMLASRLDTSRLVIIKDQFLTIGLGIGLIAFIYFAMGRRVLRFFSRLGFLLSLLPLLPLVFPMLRIPGVIEAGSMNHADRILKIFGHNIHVIEVAKLGMVMYFAWAISACNAGELKFGKWLNGKLSSLNLRLFRKPLADRFTARGLDLFFYFFLPLALIALLTIGRSLFTPILILGICTLMMLIGKVLKFKELFLLLLLCAAGAAGVAAIHSVSGGTAFRHLQSSLGRFDLHYEKRLADAVGTPDFQSVLDSVRQPISGKIAIKEGGLIGKGPGRSTQKYTVNIMYEDYMYAFIVEEYGLVGALIILILYSSLLARGNIIVRNIPDEFGKMAVAGTVFLITGQAIFHILMNVGILPIAGQTLPMLSHGRFSFLMFSVAFGILLNLSKLGKENIELETDSSAPIRSPDESGRG